MEVRRDWLKIRGDTDFQSMTIRTSILNSGFENLDF